MTMSHDIYGSIYLITNRVNGKIYIGQTKLSQKAKTVEYKTSSRGSLSRYRKDRPIICAMKKYGFNNFEFAFIDTASSQGELDLKERSHIEQRKSTDRHTGYNVENGGIRGKVTPRVMRDRISATLKAMHRDGMIVSPMRGRRHSEETRAKMRKAHSAIDQSNRVVTNETRQKQSKVRKGWCSNPRCYRPVMCIETGQVFPTIRAAGIAMNLPKGAHTNIGSAAAARIKTAYGYTWKYMTESPWPKPTSKESEVAICV